MTKDTRHKMGLNGPPLRRKNMLLMLVFVIVVPFTILFLVIGPGKLNDEEILWKKKMEDITSYFSGRIISTRGAIENSYSKMSFLKESLSG